MVYPGGPFWRLDALILVSANDENYRFLSSRTRTLLLQAMSGQAMDRHLLGLRLAAQEADRPVPSLLTHAAFERLLHFNVSTSQVPTKHEALMAFGPYYDDCYGLVYNPQETKILTSVTSYHSCQATSSEKYVDLATLRNATVKLQVAV